MKEAVNLDREFPGRYDLSLGSPYCHPLLSSGSLHLTPHAFILPTLGTQLLVILVSISYLSSVIILSLSLSGTSDNDR